MKMAKKLLALVLTGVMAVSMLTGCALTDAAKAKAMEKALNDHAQGNTQTIKYDYKSSLNSKADKIWEQEYKKDTAPRRHRGHSGQCFSDWCRR